MAFYSQDGQDKFIAELFQNKRNGVFIDIGAFDGTTFSNTLFLEKELEWTGICIEPNPLVFATLESNRKCLCVNGCVANLSGKYKFLAISGAASMLSGLINSFDNDHLDRIERIIKIKGGQKQIFDVPVFNLQQLFDENKITDIDYCNVDVEGAELGVLQSIDFSKTNIRVLTVENNNNSKDVLTFLKPFGYKLLTKIGADEVYERYSKRYRIMLNYKLSKSKHLISSFKNKLFQ